MTYYRYTYLRLICTKGYGWGNDPQQITEFSYLEPEQFKNSLPYNHISGDYMFHYTKLIVHEISKEDYDEARRYSSPIKEYTFYL